MRLAKGNIPIVIPIIARLFLDDFRPEIPNIILSAIKRTARK